MFKRQIFVLFVLGMMPFVAGSCDENDKFPLVPLDGGGHPERIGSFLESCGQDNECLSGYCLSFNGNTKRCSQKCTGPSGCPSLKGWSCNPQSLCTCVPQGAQSTVCGVDGDCDGQPDKKSKTEICNGEDDDCNGEVDDVAADTPGATKYYRDADGDGFGDQQTSRWWCSTKSGWVTNNQDCDDTRKEVNPNMPEICGNDLDDNCNGKKDDVEVCGYTPILVPDVKEGYDSIQLKECTKGNVNNKGLDITEILGKQDTNLIKYTVRLAGSPIQDSCASYTLFFGNAKKEYSMVYIFRASASLCGQDFVDKEVYRNNEKLPKTDADMKFNSADPGHVSFTIPKTELFPFLNSPTYTIKACSNAPSYQDKDIKECNGDSCETPVHR